MRVRSACVVLVSSLAAQITFAHHGKDFLLVESYEVPHPGDVYLVTSTGLFIAGDDAALELEPSFLVGLVPRVAFELHAHVDKERDEPVRYEATAPSLHVQITPPESAFPVNVGVSAEYEIAAADEARDRFEARLIAERAFGRAKVVGNFVVEHERGGETTPGYGVGVRYDLTEQFACGMEAQGPFTRADRHELLFGVYAEPNERVTLKAGVGPTFSDDEAGFAFRAGVVCRL